MPKWLKCSTPAQFLLLCRILRGTCTIKVQVPSDLGFFSPDSIAPCDCTVLLGKQRRSKCNKTQLPVLASVTCPFGLAVVAPVHLLPPVSLATVTTASCCLSHSSFIHGAPRFAIFLCRYVYLNYWHPNRQSASIHLNLVSPMLLFAFAFPVFRSYGKFYVHLRSAPSMSTSQMGSLSRHGSLNQTSTHMGQPIRFSIPHPPDQNPPLASTVMFRFYSIEVVSHCRLYTPSHARKS